jgi:GNAT superfamily N-acetyltransferase
MNASVHIRHARPGNAERLKEIGVTGWETTYAGFITSANRQVYLSGAFWSVERLRDVIRDEQCIALVAEVDGAIAGFITIEPRTTSEVELTRLYVDPEARSAGVGRALWEHGLTLLGTREVSVALVNVFGDNAAGRRFYEQLGFELIEETTTDVGTQTVYDVWYRLAV